jgi:hypothetical protein
MMSGICEGRRENAAVFARSQLKPSLRGAKRRSNPAVRRKAHQKESLFSARLPACSWIASLRSQ